MLTKPKLKKTNKKTNKLNFKTMKQQCASLWYDLLLCIAYAE